MKRKAVDEFELFRVRVGLERFVIGLQVDERNRLRVRRLRIDARNLAVLLADEEQVAAGHPRDQERVEKLGPDEGPRCRVRRRRFGAARDLTGSPRNALRRLNFFGRTARRREQEKGKRANRPGHRAAPERGEIGVGIVVKKSKRWHADNADLKTRITRIKPN